MKLFKHLFFGLLLTLSLVACKKNNPSDNNDTEVIAAATNFNEPVKQGEANCTESITGNIRLKAVTDTPQNTNNTVNIKINSKTEKLYPSGGYILVYELTRTASLIKIEYKQVHTACGNPGAAAFLPATSAPRITNLAPGSYPIEIKTGSQVNKGVLQITGSGSPTLTMQTSNGIVVE